MGAASSRAAVAPPPVPAAVYAALRAIEDAASVAAIADATTAAAAALVAPAAAALLISDTARNFTVISAAGTHAAVFRGLRSPPGVGLTQAIIDAGGAPVRVADLRARAAAAAAAALAARTTAPGAIAHILSLQFVITSVVGAPIFSRGTEGKMICGALFIFNRTSPPRSKYADGAAPAKLAGSNTWSFGDADVEVLVALAGAASAALARARAADTARSAYLLSRGIFASATPRAGAAGDARSGLERLRALSVAVAEVACPALDCEAAALLVVDARRGELWHVGASGAVVRRPLGAGLLARAAASREPLLVDAPAADAAYDAAADGAAAPPGTALRSLLVLPLREQLLSSSTPFCALLILANKMCTPTLLARHADGVPEQGDVLSPGGSRRTVLRALGATAEARRAAGRATARFAAADADVALVLAADLERALTPLAATLEAAKAVLDTDAASPQGPLGAWSAKATALLSSLSSVNSGFNPDAPRVPSSTPRGAAGAEPAGRAAAPGAAAAEPTLLTWGWSALDAAGGGGGGSARLEAAALALLDGARGGLLARVGVPRVKAAALVAALARLYLPLPFHCFAHAVNTLQASALLAAAPAAAAALAPVDELCLLVAALGHDVGHRGRTNTFEFTSASALGLLHGDDGTLERHHAAEVSRTLVDAAGGTDVLAALPPHAAAAARRRVVRAILSTDMTRHTDQVESLGARARRAGGCAFDGEKSDDVDELAGYIVHAADFAGCVRGAADAVAWCQRITAEFREQARAEVAAGLPATIWMNGLDLPQKAARLQVAFLVGVVLPLWRSCAALLEGCGPGRAARARWRHARLTNPPAPRRPPRRLDEPLANITSNVSTFQRVVEDGPAPPASPEPLAAAPPSSTRAKPPRSP